MHVLLLDGTPADDPLVAPLRTALLRTLEAAGAVVDHQLLREIPLAWCQGCFECWTHTPGVCKTDDAGRAIAERFARSDVVIGLTRTAFGGYDSALKGAVDRLLPVMLPFFTRVDGEVHHAHRYARRPAFAVLGVHHEPDVDVERTFRTLVERNALNLAAPQWDALLVDRPVDDLRAAALVAPFVRELLAPQTDHSRAPHVRSMSSTLPDVPLSADAPPPSRALLLVGSAKPTGHSTSEALGQALLERLASRGIAGSVHHVHREAHAPKRLAALVDAIRAHDLLLISAPLYFDALPALVVRTLEAVAEDRARHPGTPLTVACLINGGFPEAHQSAVACAIVALFARAAHARWAGALQLGGGGVLDGRPLEAVGQLADPLREALDQAADTLAIGRGIAGPARERFAEPLLPPRVYTAAGDAQWLWTAAHHHALTRLWDRPASTPPA